MRGGGSAGRSPLPHLGTQGDPGALPHGHQHSPPRSQSLRGGRAAAAGEARGRPRAWGPFEHLRGVWVRGGSHGYVFWNPDALPGLCGPAAEGAARQVEGGAAPPPPPPRQRNSARTPGCRGSGSEDPSKVKPAREGRGLLGASLGSLRSGWEPSSAPRPRWVPGGVHGARSGIPERSAPSLPARPQLRGAAVRLVAPGSGGRVPAPEPWNPDGGDPAARPAGMRQGGARLRGRRGVGLGGEFAASGPGEGGGSPSFLRGGGKAARGPGRPAALPGPAGEGRSQVAAGPSQSLPCLQAPVPRGPRRSRL